MPAADPADQQAARSIEQSLREAVERFQRPLVELEWFMALPKRIRRSGRLIETAQTEARVFLDHVRDNWAKVRKAEAAREAHLAELRAQPRDLECLRSPDVAAWQGVGRRKRRCHKFEAIGRAFTSRQGITGAPVVHQPSPSVIYDVHALKSGQSRLPKRPDTPEGLRQAVWDDPQLRQAASRPIRAGYTSPSRPPTPAPPSVPTPVAPPSEPPMPPYPHSLTPEVFDFLGTKVSRDVAWIVACGHRALTKRSDYPIRETVVDTAQVEELEPGLLGALSDLLFPHGVSRWDLAVHPAGLDALTYFCLGWFHVVHKAT